MSDYYLYCIVLEDCPYSNSAVELVQNYNIKDVEINRIQRINKDTYKTKLIETFPQIYLKRKNRKGSLLLGGYTELKSFFDKFYKNGLNKKYIKEFVENNNWNNKATLRLIQLINK